MPPQPPWISGFSSAVLIYISQYFLFFKGVTIIASHFVKFNYNTLRMRVNSNLNAARRADRNTLRMRGDSRHAARIEILLRSSTFEFQPKGRPLHVLCNT